MAPATTRTPVVLFARTEQIVNYNCITESNKRTLSSG